MLRAMGDELLAQGLIGRPLAVDSIFAEFERISPSS
jgi:hypothetical protein